MMIEILCSLLTGMPYGRDICRMYDAPIENKRMLGHFFMVIDIESFEDKNKFKKRLKKLMNEIRAEPSKKGKKVMAPGDPEKKQYKIRIKKGIPVDNVTLQKFYEIAKITGYRL